MWTSAPVSAGPVNHVRRSPLCACSIDVFIASMGAAPPSDEPMWYSGVKNPVPWYVADAIIANMAITVAPTMPPTTPRPIALFHTAAFRPLAPVVALIVLPSWSDADTWHDLAGRRPAPFDVLRAADVCAAPLNA
jgi:hypothetical protein